MILSTSIALDADILDALFTNEVDDEEDVFIFNDLFLLLSLLAFNTCHYQDISLSINLLFQ